MNDDENQNGNGNVRLIHSATPVDQRKRNCILKLEELLAQAKQGHFVALCTITVHDDNNGTYGLNWVGSEITFIGALKVLERLLVDRVAQSMRPR